MFPTQILLRNLRSSPELSERIRDLCEKLGHLHPRILNCRVAIEQPMSRSRRPMPYCVEIQVRLQGRELVVDPQQDLELALALRKAFLAIRRQLREAFSLERDQQRTMRTLL